MGVKYGESLLPSHLGLHPRGKKKKTKVNIQTAIPKSFGMALEKPKARCMWLAGHQVFSAQITCEGVPLRRGEAAGITWAASLVPASPLEPAPASEGRTPAPCEYGRANHVPCQQEEYGAVVGQAWKGAGKEEEVCPGWGSSEFLPIKNAELFRFCKM